MDDLETIIRRNEERAADMKKYHAPSGDNAYGPHPRPAPRVGKLEDRLNAKARDRARKAARRLKREGR